MAKTAHLPILEEGTAQQTTRRLKTREVYRSQANLLKALANEARLMMVDRLGRGDCTVGELVEMVGYDQSTVSKHLALLRAHGIVVDRREGNKVVYRLVIPCVLTFMSCAAQALRDRKG